MRKRAEEGMARVEERLRTLEQQHQQAQQASQAAYVDLEQRLREKDNLLKIANDHINQLEMEKEALQLYEAQYLASSEAIMKASVAREIHLAWVEGEGRVLKEHAARLYQEKRHAEALVAQANHQGFLVVPSNAPVQAP